MAFATRFDKALGCNPSWVGRLTSSMLAPLALSTISGQEQPLHMAVMKMETSTPSRFPKQVSSLHIMSAAFPDKTSRNTRVTDVP